MSDLFDNEPAAIDAHYFAGDKPDIDKYLSDYEPEWEQIWEIAPVEDMTDGMIHAMIDMVFDHWDDTTWEELLQAMMDDYWEWFNESYSDNN